MGWKYGTYSGGPPGGQGFRIQRGPRPPVRLQWWVWKVPRIRTRNVF